MSIQDDDNDGDSTADELAHASSGKRSSGNGPSNLLYGLGILMFIASGALMTVPGFVPQVAWVFKHAAKHGITSGPLFLCGLSLCAMGWIARAVIAQRNEEDESQQRLLFEQLASDLALVRTGLDALKGDVVRLNATSQSVLQLAESNETDESAQNQQDAIFRLAASLDQVGAHIDHRVQAQHTALQAAIKEINAAISAVREDITQLATAPAPIERIDEPAHSSQESASAPSAVAPSSIDLRDKGLGLLDTLDDNGESRGSKTSPRLQPIVSQGERAREILASNPQAPLPTDRGNDRNGKIELKAPASNRPAPASRGDTISRVPDDEEFSTRDKLELLRSLMDDQRVREALGTLMGDEQ